MRLLRNKLTRSQPVKSAASRRQQSGVSPLRIRLAADRRLAYKASDAGLLNPDLAAGVRLEKGAKKHSVRLDKW
jgi:hypothetical protein